MRKPRERTLNVGFGAFMVMAGVVLVTLTVLISLGVFGDLEPKHYAPLVPFWLLGGYMTYAGFTFLRKDPS